MNRLRPPKISRLWALIILLLALSACGGEAEPTQVAADVTGWADSWTLQASFSPTSSAIGKLNTLIGGIAVMAIAIYFFKRYERERPVAKTLGLLALVALLPFSAQLLEALFNLLHPAMPGIGNAVRTAFEAGGETEALKTAELAVKFFGRMGFFSQFYEVLILVLLWIAVLRSAFSFDARPLITPAAMTLGWLLLPLLTEIALDLSLAINPGGVTGAAADAVGATSAAQAGVFTLLMIVFTIIAYIALPRGLADMARTRLVIDVQTNTPPAAESQDRPVRDAALTAVGVAALDELLNRNSSLSTNGTTMAAEGPPSAGGPGGFDGEDGASGDSSVSPDGTPPDGDEPLTDGPPSTMSDDEFAAEVEGEQLPDAMADDTVEVPDPETETAETDSSTADDGATPSTVTPTRVPATMDEEEFTQAVSTTEDSRPNGHVDAPEPDAVETVPKTLSDADFEAMIAQGVSS